MICLLRRRWYNLSSINAYVSSEVILTVYSRILHYEAVLCQDIVSLERHKEGVCAGNYDSWRCVSAESTQQWRRVIRPVVHCDAVTSTGEALLNVQQEELQFNNLQTDI